MVLAKVGAAGSEVIAASSASRSARPAVNAAGNAAGTALSQGGTPPYGPVHGASSGSFSASTRRRATSARAASWADGAGGVVVVGSVVVVSGGFRTGPVLSPKTESALIQPDGSLGPWSEGPKLKVGRFHHAMGAWKDAVYVVGGLTGNNQIVGVCQDLLYAIADDRMVVGEQYPGHISTPADSAFASSGMPILIEKPCPADV